MTRGFPAEVQKLGYDLTDGSAQLGLESTSQAVNAVRPRLDVLLKLVSSVIPRPVERGFVVEQSALELALADPCSEKFRDPGQGLQQ